MTQLGDSATDHAWTSLGGEPELAARVTFEPAGDVLPARLPVRQLARATVGACSLAAAELLARRNSAQVPAVQVAEDAVATAFHSERQLRVDGRGPVNFAPLSGFWRAADGWVRTHANYPQHRDALLTALGVTAPEGADDQSLAPVVAAEIGQRPARLVQEAAYGVGGLAVAVAPGPPDRHPPLAEAWSSGAASSSRLSPAALPAEGVRVLDLTRVIAGPVATRTLALLGADVLRVDPPALPEDPDSHIDTGMGKRSTLLDLATASGQRSFDELLDTADVVVTAYRPGALDRFGLSAASLSARRPGLIIAQLCAWGWDAPGGWAARRGFDSLVQAGWGIAARQAEGTADENSPPGVLPAQALDHGTGYLMAAAVLRALTERQRDGTGQRLRLSLAGTANWLMRGIRPEAPVAAADEPYDPERRLAETDSSYGRLRYALPPVNYPGAPETWTAPATRWGGDEARWQR